MNAHQSGRLRGLLRSPAGALLLAFLALAGFFLVTEHTAHLYGALPYLLLLAAPLLHLFMHGGHGAHQASQEDPPAGHTATPAVPAAHAAPATLAGPRADR